MPGFGLEKTGVGFASGSLDRVFEDEQIVQAAFNHFRKHGFPFRRLAKHECMSEINKLARTQNDKLLQTTTGYSVADTYHPHRFDGRYFTSKLSPREAFDTDDTWLRTCLAKSVEFDGEVKATIFGLHRSSVGIVKACSNFRPGFALYQYRKHCPVGGVVFDTSMGYGGRLVGFLASQAGEYVGVDPNPLVCEGNVNMARDFGRWRDVECHCEPAEDLDHDVVRGRCDFAFTSPPYFCAEVYTNDDNQSCHRYKEAVQWRNSFLLPMMKLQYAALKSGCMSCVNIADVKVDGQVVPLVKWCIEAGKRAGFDYKGQTIYKLRRHFGSGNENKTKPRAEAVLKFRKP